MRALKKLLFIAVLLRVNGLFAQNFQLAGIGYSNFAKTKIKDSPTSQAVEFQELSFFAKLPIKFKNQKTVLMNTLQYGLVQPTAHNSPLFAAAETTKNLHSVSLSLMLVQKMGRDWTLIAALMPTLASDFEKALSGDDLLMQGSILVSKKLNETWTLGGGAIYTAQLGDPRFLPAVQLRYLHNKHFINVLLPSFANYLYSIDKSEKWHVGFRLATNGGNFNVNNPDFTKVIPNSINNAIQSRINLGAVVNFQLTKNILLEANGGISVARKYRFEDTAKRVFTYNSDNGGFVNIGILLTQPPKGN
jgi:Domain of unknown function (DUF6268)